MSVRKQLIKLNNKLESSWSSVNFEAHPICLRAGWYVTEFMVQGAIDHTPRIVITRAKGKEVERHLVGFHSGRNRMLVYLPDGQLIAHSESLEFERLARVSTIEGRARILLICGRYLRDFFSLKVIFKMLLMQFQDNFELSSNLLQFYGPARGGDGYLDNINRWQKFQGFGKQLSWLGRGVKIAVIIEDNAQRRELEDLLVQPDAILFAGEKVPNGIDYCIALKATDHLRSPAILMLKRAVKACSIRPNLVYTDHDYQPRGSDLNEELNAEVNIELGPVFKPQPSHAYLYCFNYIGFATMFSAEMTNSVGTAELLNDEVKYHLALDCFTDISKVLAFSEVLFSSSRLSPPQTPEPTGKISPWPNINCHRQGDYNVLVAQQEWSDAPSVDLIIPTRDGLAVLKPCVDTILSKTSYPNYNIIIADNGSELPETHEYFAEIKQDPRVSIVDFPGEFNYSAINNFAVAKGESEYVALVNNDIEVIDGDWLTQMMVWVSQESVGIVGAKLLFGNGKVQHAGVTIGVGNAAGHIHRLEDGDAPGYQLRCLATQNMMAVTAACLITPRALFEELGGLDEVAFKVAYNDVDYCLRVESRGLEIIWTPQAVLHHHESVSRGDDMSDQHIERYFRELEVFQSRWKSKGFVDKYYSKHLRITDEGVFPQVQRYEEDKLVSLI
ncbi:MAG: GT2 family glycosyltransferase [Arenicella sp.]|jgi:GT2 family glycosyltransferase